MPEIQAFRGIRYDLGHVGSLSHVVAPPYDVISGELQDELYKRHPCNVVRLILNRMEPGDDDEANNRYTRAARFFKNWQSEGVLFTESDPAIYVYHQQFTLEARTHLRRGFMARVRLAEPGQGLIFPHEETMRAPKIDRLMLTAVCKANLSQVFGLYPDPQNEAQDLLEAAVAGQTPIEAADHLGVIHRMWPVTDVDMISAVAAAMGPKPVFIADGHHRYETAWAWRQQIYDSGFLTLEHPANYVLMMCVGMHDPGLFILPTHRLFSGLAPISAEELAERLGDCFLCRTLGQGPEPATEAWEEIQTGDDQATLALFTQKDRRWTLAQLTEPGRAKMAEVAADHNEDWRELGVSILHRLVMDTLLDPEGTAEAKYVHLVDEVVSELYSGAYSLAALVMPASLQHIQNVSSRGERLPAKSTYFYPKLLSGLVINPLE
jgi:uncharacterized protein (DUF1015 family)